MGIRLHHRTARAGRFALCVALFCLVTTPIFAQAQHHYWESNQEKALTLSTDRVAFRFRQGLTEVERDAFLEVGLGLTPATDVLNLPYDAPIGLLHVVPLAAFADPGSALTLLSGAAEVYYALPVFAAPDRQAYRERVRVLDPQEAADQLDHRRAEAQANDHGVSVVVAHELMQVSAAQGIYAESPVVMRILFPEVVSTNMVAIRVRDEAAEEKLAPYLAQPGVEFFSRFRQSNGQISIVARVDMTTPFEALNFVTTLAESGLVLHAQPEFLPLITFEFTTASAEFLAERAAAQAPEVPPEDGYYYYSRGREIHHLELSTERIGVRFADEVPMEERAAVVAHADLLPLDQVNQKGNVLESGFNLLDVKPGRSVREVENIIASLGSNPNILSALPVFRGKSGKETLMTDEFYASFPVETPSEEIEELVAQYGLEVVRMKERPRIGKVGYDFRVSDDSPGNAMETANLFVELGLVLAASPQFLELYSIALGTTLNDQYFSSQWALGPSKLDAANAWDTTTGHPSITIAIIDTGVDEDHEDLNSKLITGRNTWPFWSNSDTDDDEGHGTEVAGIAAAETNMFGNVGVAGVSWASMIMPIKVIDIEEKEA